MHAFICFFVSQWLGPAIGTVQMQSDTCGTVRIRPEGGAFPPLLFEFDPAQFGASLPLQSMVADVILRTAITQAHKAANKPAGEEMVEGLLPSYSPWLGDLYPESEATKAMRMGIRDREYIERRKGNPGIESCIAQAIRIRRSHGRRAAAELLRSAGVPPSVIRRVLTCAVHRRRASDR